ncbi:unnamed protein product, partial [Ceratitis capitata]
QQNSTNKYQHQYANTEVNLISTLRHPTLSTMVGGGRQRQRQRRARCAAPKFCYATPLIDVTFCRLELNDWWRLPPKMRELSAQSAATAFIISKGMQKQKTQKQ